MADLVLHQLRINFAVVTALRSLSSGHMWRYAAGIELDIRYLNSKILSETSQDQLKRIICFSKDRSFMKT